MALTIRLLQVDDIADVAAAFKEKPAGQYERYYAEQEASQRTVLIARVGGVFSGYVTVRWQSSYPPFCAEKIPEIQDFNVLPQFRRRGIGNHLMDEAEQIVAARFPIVGIGVGMYADYGTAQRMYVRRGYLPDGRGLFYGDHRVQPGESVVVDDDLVLYFTKPLHA